MPSNHKWVRHSFDTSDKDVPLVTVSCSETHPKDCLIADQTTQAVTLQSWPVEPAPLAADPTYDILMDIYDSFLCAIPLFLIAKTSLCIYAHHIDKENRGNYIDQVSRLTTFLLNFNDQVSLHYIQILALY